ncbi:MAG: START domain-containing protein [Candidatus Omnitrophota bacterium]|nr:START domain-containing protein [Candidatus Omnitrophota bacterium]
MCLIIGFLFIFSSGLYAGENPWKLRINDQGVSVYTRKVDGSPILEFKGDMIVDAPLAKIVALFEDEKGLPVWYYQCTQARLLKDEGPQDKVLYIVLDLPWPVAHRDSIFRRSKSSDTNGAVSYSIKALPDELPLKKGMVRVQAINSVWRFTPLADGQTEIYFQQHSDPGGSIPALLVNRLVKDIPFNSFKNFRQFIKDSEK